MADDRPRGNEKRAPLGRPRELWEDNMSGGPTKEHKGYMPRRQRRNASLLNVTLTGIPYQKVNVKRG